MGEVGFITEIINVDARSIFAAVIKFVNHENKVVKFNSLLTFMGLNNFRWTPRGKLVKFEIIQRRVNREGDIRNQRVNRTLNVKSSDVKLLADLLSSKRQQITAYLNITKELEI